MKCAVVTDNKFLFIAQQVASTMWLMTFHSERWQVGNDEANRDKRVSLQFSPLNCSWRNQRDITPRQNEKAKPFSYITSWYRLTFSVKHYCLLQSIDMFSVRAAKSQIITSITKNKSKKRRKMNYVLSVCFGISTSSRLFHLLNACLDEWARKHT